MSARAPSNYPRVNAARVYSDFLSHSSSLPLSFKRDLSPRSPSSSRSSSKFVPANDNRTSLDFMLAAPNLSLPFLCFFSPFLLRRAMRGEARRGERSRTVTLTTRQLALWTRRIFISILARPLYRRARAKSPGLHVSDERLFPIDADETFAIAKSRAAAFRKSRRPVKLTAARVREALPLVFYVPSPPSGVEASA